MLLLNLLLRPSRRPLSSPVQVRHEADILSVLSHPNIIRMHACYETPRHVWMVLDYCAGSGLATLLHQDKQLPEASAKVFLLLNPLMPRSFFDRSLDLLDRPR